MTHEEFDRRAHRMINAEKVMLGATLIVMFEQWRTLREDGTLAQLDEIGHTLNPELPRGWSIK